MVTPVDPTGTAGLLLFRAGLVDDVFFLARDPDGAERLYRLKKAGDGSVFSEMDRAAAAALYGGGKLPCPVFVPAAGRLHVRLPGRREPIPPVTAPGTVVTGGRRTRDDGPSPAGEPVDGAGQGPPPMDFSEYGQAGCGKQVVTGERASLPALSGPHDSLPLDGTSSLWFLLMKRGLTDRLLVTRRLDEGLEVFCFRRVAATGADEGGQSPSERAGATGAPVPSSSVASREDSCSSAFLPDDGGIVCEKTRLSVLLPSVRTGWKRAVARLSSAPGDSPAARPGFLAAGTCILKGDGPSFLTIRPR